MIKNKIDFTDLKKSNDLSVIVGSNDYYTVRCDKTIDDMLYYYNFTIKNNTTVFENPPIVKSFKVSSFTDIELNELNNICSSILNYIKESFETIDDTERSCDIFDIIFNETINYMHKLVELEPVKKDKLDVIFDKQCNYCISLDDSENSPESVPLVKLFNISNKALHNESVSDEEKKLLTYWIERHISAMQSELDELKRCFPWKWWKHNQDFNVAHAREESIDIVHFLIETLIMLGMNSNSTYLEYTDKNKINFDRQKEGY